MEPSEAKVIFQELSELLMETGFQWVVENLDVDLNRGIQVTQQLRRFQEPQPGEQSAARQRERRETTISTRPHTEVERLSRMVDEIERCVLLPIRIADDLPKKLSSDGSPLSGIEVVDPETDETVFRIDSRAAVAKDQAASLEADLAQIRGMINAT